MTSHLQLVLVLVLVLVLLVKAGFCMTIPQKPRAVIVPGFLYGGDSFTEMASALRQRGIDAVVAPVSTWHWIPMLGGRSVRPILERISFAVDECAGMTFGDDDDDDDDDTPLIIPWSYGLQECWQDFRHNPGGVLAVGGSTDPAEFPSYTPRGDFTRSGAGRGGTGDGDNGSPPAPPVFLIAHSAAGWISRILLSERPYAGPAFAAASRVAGLVTLGTPHEAAPSVALANVAFANAEPAPRDVPCLAVAAGGTTPKDGGTFAKESYALCSSPSFASSTAAAATATAEGGNMDNMDENDGSGSRSGVDDMDGDGVTPVESALAFEGAETLLLPMTALHAPNLPSFIAPALAEKQKRGAPWYGSAVAMDEWVPWLLRQRDSMRDSDDERP